MNKENLNHDGQILEPCNIESHELNLIYDHDVPSQDKGKQTDENTIDILSEQIGQKVIQLLTSYLASQRVNDKRTSDIDNTILSYLKELYKDAVYNDRLSGKKFFSNHLIISNQDRIISMIDNLNNQVGNLTALVESQKATIAEQASIIKRQHEAIALFESDVISIVR